MTSMPIDSIQQSRHFILHLCTHHSPFRYTESAAGLAGWGEGPSEGHKTDLKARAILDDRLFRISKTPLFW